MRRLAKVCAMVMLALAPVLVVAQFLLGMESFRVFAASWVLGRHVNERPCAIAPGRKFTIDYHGMTYFGDSSTLIDHAILCYGDFGLTEQTFLSQAIIRLDRQDLTFLDVGANSGLHSLYVSRMVATVHSFEPYRPVLERFEKSLEASQIKNVIVHPVGLGEEDADLPFEEPPRDNLGTGSFVTGLMEKNSASDLTLRVVNGDSYFESHGIDRIDVFKIDTEGFEKAVLRGLKKTFASSRPVGTLELTQKPGFGALFQNRQDLLDSLPPEYNLFTLHWNEAEGPRLRPFDLEFSEGMMYQAVVAAVPSEVVPLLSDLVDSPR